MSSKDLFSASEQDNARFQPLAARMRATHLDDYVGQQHILAPGTALREAINHDQLHSMILWGPPGVGKTTLAKIIAQNCDAQFIELSAVLAGVKDIRAAVEKAHIYRSQYNKATVLFVDEVHRFNKSQQDAFLPHIENGDVLFIGATTENPSFELNSALLSRARVYVLQSLQASDLLQLIERVLEKDSVLASRNVQFEDGCKDQLIAAADGDARRLLNLLEVALDLVPIVDGQQCIDATALKQVLAQSYRRFDKGGEQFYDQISALHKSVRGSSPDAALYWMCRMLDSGADPLYIGRRLIRMATEDIGLADPRALRMTLDACETYERLGSPEGELALAQATLYLASAPKSNAAYLAYKKAKSHIAQDQSRRVPIHLRNAPTKLMKEMGFGQEYQYAHDYPDAYVPGENYFPEALKDRQYYQPVNRGLEQKIQEKLRQLRQLDKASADQRYA